MNRAQAGKLRPTDIQGEGFTISNLGMYGVDAFNAIVIRRRPPSSPSAASPTGHQRSAGRPTNHDADPVLRPPRPRRHARHS